MAQEPTQSGAGTPPPEGPPGPDNARRRFLAAASSLAVAAGVAAGYGTLGAMGARFLYPARRQPRGWMYVAAISRLQPGQSLRYRSPSGEDVTIARRSAGTSAEDFVALSSTCPHLGCKVSWEALHARFFCPCHNGTFDADGRATGGPPAKAGQSLKKFPLRVEGGLLSIEVPLPPRADRV